MNNTNKKMRYWHSIFEVKVNPLRKVIQNYNGLMPSMFSTET